MADALPTIEDFMAVKQTTGEPCACPEEVRLIHSELSREAFHSRACAPCRARRAVEDVAEVAESL